MRKSIELHRLLITAVLAGQLGGLPAALAAPAFPGANGAGVNATGGRTGSVVHVTNLNASGAGSLADAVSAGNRIVVFDVSGIIDLTNYNNGVPTGGKTIKILNANITIAGQTAPGDGICLKGGSLEVVANNVIIRHLRSRRGFIVDTNKGDAITVKKPTGTGDLTKIYLDHVSTSWATDENLTVTHIKDSTVAYSIAAEGLDYHNSAQSPFNHSEGSLWGSASKQGLNTMHHMLYAHNRLRNPRSTGFPGATTSTAPVQTFYNSVVYDWHHYASHTGSEAVKWNVLSNYYKPGASTVVDSGTQDPDPFYPDWQPFNIFVFTGDNQARVHLAGNFVNGYPTITADNGLGVSEDSNSISASHLPGMISASPFGTLPSGIQSSANAFDTVLDEAGATLPTRDTVDQRLAKQARDGTGGIIGKETDLAPADRWSTYHSLAKQTDTDNDGIPDFWETRFGSNPNSAGDAMTIVAGGYARIEHYLNNSDPGGNNTSIYYASTHVSRPTPTAPGEFRLQRTGSTAAEVTVNYTVSGDAVAGTDYVSIGGNANIGVGKLFKSVDVQVLPGRTPGRKIILTLNTANQAIGCPRQVVMEVR